MDLANLPAIVDDFFSLLGERQVSYLLVGGIALLQYVQGRNTEDIDLILSTADLEKLREIAIEDRSGFFVKGNYRGLRIDLFLSENPLFNAVSRDYSTSKTLLNRQIPCATPEGLVLLKLYALPSLYRQYNFTRVNLYEGDIASLLHSCRIDPGRLLCILGDYMTESDLASLKQIVSEIQQRISRFNKGNGRNEGS